jgi:hypothetical protein
VIFCASLANADLITWTFDGEFDDGGSLFGWFEVDTSSNTLLDWDITTTAGSILSGFNFNTSNSSLFDFNAWGVNPNSFLITRDDPYALPYINLSFTDTFFVAGSIDLDTTGFFSLRVSACGRKRPFA